MFLFLFNLIIILNNFSIVTASTGKDYGTRLRSISLSSDFKQQTATNLIPEQTACKSQQLVSGKFTCLFVLFVYPIGQSVSDGTIAGVTVAVIIILVIIGVVIITVIFIAFKFRGIIIIHNIHL